MEQMHVSWLASATGSSASLSPLQQAWAADWGQDLMVGRNEVVELAMPAEQVALSLLAGDVKSWGFDVGMRSFSCSRWIAVQAAMVRMLVRQESAIWVKSAWWVWRACSSVGVLGVEGRDSMVPRIDSVNAPLTPSSLDGLQDELGASQAYPTSSQARLLPKMTAL